MLRIAINGFGRIGRCVLRAYAERADLSDIIEIVAVNAATPPLEDRLYNFKYDSVHGTFSDVEAIDAETLHIKNKSIKMLFERQVDKLNWKDMGIDIVLECTGAFNNYAQAAEHINSGADKVIVSAPCKNADATIVLGANEESLQPEHKVISIGSCTTNCLAPIAKILNNSVGIESGFMTTIHSYTNDQVLLDSKHKDKRRSRAAALSMIPSSTGAAKSLGIVLPELDGRLDGVAVRVPTPNVSMIDLTFNSSQKTSPEEINNIIKIESKNILNILSTTLEEVVSIDMNHNPSSAIFDLTQTKVINQKLCRIAAWYDNEWGFSNRMLDIAMLANKGK